MLRTQEIGRSLAQRGLPALTWDMEEQDALQATQAEEEGTVKARRCTDTQRGAEGTGVRFQRCGGGRRVIRRSMGE